MLVQVLPKMINVVRAPPLAKLAAQHSRPVPLQRCALFIAPRLALGVRETRVPACGLAKAVASARRLGADHGISMLPETWLWVAE